MWTINSWQKLKVTLLRKLMTHSAQFWDNSGQVFCICNSFNLICTSDSPLLHNNTGRGSIVVYLEPSDLTEETSFLRRLSNLTEPGFLNGEKHFINQPISQLYCLFIGCRFSLYQHVIVALHNGLILSLNWPQVITVIPWHINWADFTSCDSRSALTSFCYAKLSEHEELLAIRRQHLFLYFP